MGPPNQCPPTPVESTGSDIADIGYPVSDIDIGLGDLGYVTRTRTAPNARIQSHMGVMAQWRRCSPKALSSKDGSVGSSLAAGRLELSLLSHLEPRERRRPRAPEPYAFAHLLKLTHTP